MAYDGILMASLADELNERLAGSRIDKIHQPEPDALVIHIKAPGEKHKLYISANSNLPHMTLIQRKMDNPLKAPMFCMLLRKHLAGGRILSVGQHALERVIYIDVESRNELGDLAVKRLIVEIMGKHSNIILIDAKDDTILDSIKRIPFSVSRLRQILPGLKYELIPADKENLRVSEKDDFLSRVDGTSKPTKVFKWIYMNYQGFSPAISMSICFQAGIPEETDIKDLTSNQTDALWTGLDSLKSCILQKMYTPVIVKENETGKYMDLSAFRLNHYLEPDYETVVKERITDVIEEYYEKKDQVNRMLHKTQNLRKFLSQRIDRLLNKLQKLKEEQLYAENAEESKIFGELILANLYQIQKGMHEIKVLNYYDPDSQEIIIKLDSRLSPSENSQKYFKKYNKLKTAQDKLAVQIEEAEADLAYLEQVQSAVELSSDPANIEEIRQELIESGILKKKHQTKGKKKSKFEPLTYMSSDGFEILVGKNNLQNDYLTLKLASNKDMWLHTKIIPGSHVIIRTKGEDVPEQTIYEAACIAAWHSKGRLSGQVPVDYTHVKNVSKPSGAKPGMVIYTTNQTLYVTPNQEDVEALKK